MVGHIYRDYIEDPEDPDDKYAASRNLELQFRLVCLLGTMYTYEYPSSRNYVNADLGFQQRINSSYSIHVLAKHALWLAFKLPHCLTLTDLAK